jgi:hypothetical protein
LGGPRISQGSEEGLGGVHCYGGGGVSDLMEVLGH